MPIQSTEDYIKWFERNMPIIEEDESCNDALTRNNANVKYTCPTCGEIGEYDPELISLEELKRCPNCRDWKEYTGPLLY